MPCVEKLQTFSITPLSFTRIAVTQQDKLSENLHNESKSLYISSQHLQWFIA